MAQASVLAFDIEAANLKADFGIVLTVGFKTVGVGKSEVLRVDDYYTTDDNNILHAEKRLLKDVYKRLMAGDIWLTHYGSRGRFDLNFLNSRLIYHRLPTLPPNHPQIDTWKVAYKDLALHSNRLVSLQEFLEIENKKTAIKGAQWILALSGHRPSMNYIVEHCHLDVKVLEEVYILLRPLITDHPHIGVQRNGECPVCGKAELRVDRWVATRGMRYKRLHCHACGAWVKGKGERIKGVIVQ